MQNCIACGSNILYPLFRPNPQPLAALNLPKTQTEAVNALRYPMNFFMCAFCGHVFNISFDYTRIPYEEDSNRMFNSGVGWQQHLFKVAGLLNSYIPDWKNQVAIDIGTGDGQFFSMLKEQHPEAKYLGFEPGVDAKKITDFPVVQDYFIPERDLKKYRPTLICCRHVIEHLENPREFVAQIAYWSLQYDLQPLCLFEVPRFDKALRMGRVGDFLYEHVNNFTKKSFQIMLQTSSYYEHVLKSFYNDEVLVAVVQPQDSGTQSSRILRQQFILMKESQDIKKELERLGLAYKNTVLWGGTGKSAAFINLHGLTADRFPYVVDSDENKVGRFVPGTGQEIRSVKDLPAIAPQAIIITTFWRANDICKEIKSLGITCPVYVYNETKLQKVQ